MSSSIRNRKVLRRVDSKITKSICWMCMEYKASIQSLQNGFFRQSNNAASVYIITSNFEVIFHSVEILHVKVLAALLILFDIELELNVILASS